MLIKPEKFLSDSIEDDDHKRSLNKIEEENEGSIEIVKNESLIKDEIKSLASVWLAAKASAWNSCFLDERLLIGVIKKLKTGSARVKRTSAAWDEGSAIPSPL